MSSTIGTLREGPLHAAIKDVLARPGDRAEVKVDRFLIDLVRADGELVEIQTGNFGPLGNKLDRLLDEHRIRIVYPVPARRKIVRVDENGEVVSARRSPHKGRPIDLFEKLVSWPSLIAHPNLVIEIILCDEDHVRGPEAGRSRSGRRRRDPGQRRLNDVVDRVELSSPEDALALLPGDAFAGSPTTRELAQRLDCTRILAGRVIYCLRAMELLCRDGVDGRTPRYRLL